MVAVFKALQLQCPLLPETPISESIVNVYHVFVTGTLLCRRMNVMFIYLTDELKGDPLSGERS